MWGVCHKGISYFLTRFARKEIMYTTWNQFISNYITYMLTTIAIILLILWLLGVVGVYTIGNFIHILLVIAVVMFLFRIIKGENPIK